MYGVPYLGIYAIGFILGNGDQTISILINFIDMFLDQDDSARGHNDFSPKFFWIQSARLKLSKSSLSATLEPQISTSEYTDFK